MAAVATELSGKIDAVKAEKDYMDAIKREVIQSHARNAKAQRLIRRLDECDANIASLLAQAADCLETLVNASVQSAPSLSQHQLSDTQAGNLVIFENRAQEWFATLHDVQIGLRSATKNLHKAQQAPLSIDVSDQNANRISNAQLGSAGRGHTLSVFPPTTGGIDTPPRTRSNTSRRGSNDSSKTVAPEMSSSMSTDWNVERPRRRRDSPESRVSAAAADSKSLLGSFMGGSTIQMPNVDETSAETSLSLSTLRQQDQNWQQLAGALTQIADQGHIHKLTGQDADHQQLAKDLQAHRTADTRLLSALLRLHMEVVPETLITPIVAARDT